MPPTTTQNHYQVLGISKTANDDEIRAAYKKLALKWHPDKNRNNKAQAEEKFKDISLAYQILSDKAKRRDYDNPPTTEHVIHCQDRSQQQQPRRQSSSSSSQSFRASQPTFASHFADESDHGWFFQDPFQLFDQMFREHAAASSQSSFGGESSSASRAHDLARSSTSRNSNRSASSADVFNTFLNDFTSSTSSWPSAERFHRQSSSGMNVAGGGGSSISAGGAPTRRIVTTSKIVNGQRMTVSKKVYENGQLIEESDSPPPRG